MIKFFSYISLFGLIFLLNIQNVYAGGYEDCLGLCSAVYNVNNAEKQMCDIGCANAFGMCGTDGIVCQLVNGGQTVLNESSTTATANMSNPLEFDTVEGVLNSVMGNLQGIIATLAVLFIVIGGLLYITSAGDSKKAEMGKAAMTAAMIGLVIAILAPSFLKEISIVLGWSTGSGGAAKTISEIAMDILKFLLGIIGALAIIMLVAGGIVYTTSAGDEDRVDMGKNMIKYSIIGLIVALLSLAIVRQVAEILIQ